MLKIYIYIGINAHVTMRDKQTIEDRDSQPLNWKDEFRKNIFSLKCLQQTQTSDFQQG